MNDYMLADEDLALAGLVETWSRMNATGQSVGDIAHVLGLIAQKASEMAESLTSETPWGTEIIARERLDPHDEFADCLDQWGDNVPESWL